MVTKLYQRLPGPQQIYNCSPQFVRRVMANIEAYRRDWFRRYGNYDAELARYDPSTYTQTAGEQEAYQLAQLNRLLDHARQHIRHYRMTLPGIKLESLRELDAIPILTKDTVRRDPMALVQDGLSQRKLWAHLTSGSTGTPLRYYHDRGTTRGHQATAEALLAAHGCHFNERKARISGTYVAPYHQQEPPFWIYIDHYRQLQCSAYHLSPHSYQHYVEAMSAARVCYGTGYATAWQLLASYIRQAGTAPPRLRAIFTDSEGISLTQQAMVEHTFGCPVYQTYGTGEVGQVAMQCAAKRYHVLTRSCVAEILDDGGRPAAPGATGQIVVTDLTGWATPFIRYQTGDLATLAADPCPCGWNSPSWTEIVGRIDDQIKTPEGRWIGRLSHVLKPGIGIRESQIAQTAADRVVIRVVPDRDFAVESMADVLAAAHRYLGDTMTVTWEVTDRLPRTPAGKLRHVVREIP